MHPVCINIEDAISDPHVMDCGENVQRAFATLPKRESGMKEIQVFAMWNDNLYPNSHSQYQP